MSVSRPVVLLSADEGLAAAVIGAMQMMRAVQRNRLGNDHDTASQRNLRERWADAIHGMMCEAAWAKWRNVYHAASTQVEKATDPGGVGVRGTIWPNGCLIINANETERPYPFVLVVGHWPRFELVGWLTGPEAAQDHWWRADKDPPSYWVPQRALRAMEDLPF